MKCCHVSAGEGVCCDEALWFGHFAAALAVCGIAGLVAAGS